MCCRLVFGRGDDLDLRLEAEGRPRPADRLAASFHPSGTTGPSASTMLRPARSGDLPHPFILERTARRTRR
jgi:hypothetical protein